MNTQRTSASAIRCTVMLLACAAAGTHAGHAQYTRNPPRTITGTVSDAGNEPLRGAVVQIEADDTLVITSYVTDEKGHYSFRNLNPGSDYHVWASFRNHHSKHHAISKFDRQAAREIAIEIDLNKD